MKVLLFDFSRVLIFPVDKSYTGSLNDLYKNQYTDTNFFKLFKLNTELLDFLTTIKNKYRLVIFTSDILQDAPEIAPQLKSIFEKIYSAKQIGMSKKDSKSYQFIVRDLQIESREAAFIDDNQENLDAAVLAGLKTILFQSNKALKEILSNL